MMTTLSVNLARTELAALARTLGTLLEQVEATDPDRSIATYDAKALLEDVQTVVQRAQLLNRAIRTRSVRQLQAFADLA